MNFRPRLAELVLAGEKTVTRRATSPNPRSPWYALRCGLVVGRDSREVCWLVFDPETSKYRRSCEGDTTGYAYGRDPKTGETVGRNDPCPCGSGDKWKRCHGRGR
ncbi:MAG: SEC-C metal-binding domain-containing protein [Solirubrobacteraceae bacterium]|nr:SEC-C metal-binding domain-containing protein [Solirubrobacteraceae bacterium]